MKQFFKILFACLCALILFFLIVFVSMIGLAAGLSSASKDTSIEDNSVLYIDISESMAEQGMENSIASFTGGESEVIGLNDMLASIREAKNDNRIKGIYIRTGICNYGWASLHEMKEAIIEFKTSKKFIYAYGEVVDQKSYYLASLADKVFLNPAGALEFKGFSINGTFFKGALDKLNVTTEAFHCGQYKGAYEPFKLEKFSEPNRYQLGVLLQDFYNEFLQTVSNKTKLDTATLTKMANEATIKFPSDALNYKFVDGLVFSDSVENIMKRKLAIKEKDKINFVTPGEFAKDIHKITKTKDKIAILYADGEIHDGEGDEGIYSKTFTKSIRKVANDDNIKGVVLRINSPGGSALASEVLYHELMMLKAKKPLVVSMGNYAASGGYYMACAGDSIFAESTTLTGSIGVVGVLFGIDKMMKEKLGVTFDQVKTSQYADFPNMSRPMTTLERTWIQSFLDSTYTTFKTRVSTARKLSMEKVEELAQGHVYSGKLAKELLLVDDCANRDRALQSVAKMAKLKDYKLVEYPKPIDPLNKLMSSLSGDKSDEAIAKKVLGDDYVIYKEIKQARNQENRIQARMPFMIEIK